MDPNFDKYADGLLPAIVQDARTRVVLMLGFMNREAWIRTRESGRVTFFSRSKGRLWTKGEESGNFLRLVDMKLDCDQDSLLVRANPLGPVCHTGADTCWQEENNAASVLTKGSLSQDLDFLAQLEQVIASRRASGEESSYVSRLMASGLNKVAQKVGEEAVELVIEAKDNDRDRFLNEAADLLFHYFVLLNAKDSKLQDVVAVLRQRHRG